MDVLGMVIFLLVGVAVIYFTERQHKHETSDPAKKKDLPDSAIKDIRATLASMSKTAEVQAETNRIQEEVISELSVALKHFKEKTAGLQGVHAAETSLIADVVNDGSLVVVTKFLEREGLLFLVYRERDNGSYCGVTFKVDESGNRVVLNRVNLLRGQ